MIEFGHIISLTHYLLNVRPSRNWPFPLIKVVSSFDDISLLHSFDLFMNALFHFLTTAPGNFLLTALFTFETAVGERLLGFEWTWTNLCYREILNSSVMFTDLLINQWTILFQSQLLIICYWNFYFLCAFNNIWFFVEFSKKWMLQDLGDCNSFLTIELQSSFDKIVKIRINIS